MKRKGKRGRASDSGYPDKLALTEGDVVVILG